MNVTRTILQVSLLERLVLVVLLGLAVRHPSAMAAAAAWSILMFGVVAHGVWNDWRRASSPPVVAPLGAMPPSAMLEAWREQQAARRAHVAFVLGSRFGELEAAAILETIHSSGYDVTPLVMLPIEVARPIE